MANDPLFRKVASLLPFDTLGADANWRYCVACADLTPTYEPAFPTARTIVGAPEVKLQGGQSCTYFNGSAAIYFTIPAATNDLTLEFDVYLPSVASQGIIDTSVSYGSSSYFGLFTTAGGLWSVMSQNSSLPTAIAATVGWHRVAIVNNGTQVYLYIDGTKVFTGTVGTTVYTNTVMTLGRCLQGTSWLTGGLKNIRLFKGVAKYTGATYSVVAPANGYVSKDAAGVQWQEAGLLTLSSVQSKFGGFSMYLNGASSLLGKAVTLGTSDFCIEGWFNVNSAVTAAFQTLAGFANDALTLGAIAYIAPEGRLMLLVGGSTNNVLSRSGGKTAITPNVWHHFALVRKGNRAAIFLDGVAEASQPLYGSVDVTKGFIGSNIFGTTQWVTGYMDSVRTTVGDSRYPLDLVDPYLDQVVYHQGFWQGGAVLGILSTEHYKAITTNTAVTLPAVTGPFGASEYAANFNGTSSMLTLASSADWNFGTGDFTIEAWVYVTGNAAVNGGSIRDGMIFAVGSSSRYTIDFGVGGNATTTGAGVWCSNGIGAGAFGNTAVPKNTWVHIAASRSAGVLRLFQDGVKTKEVAVAIALGSTEPAYIGGGPVSAYPDYFPGRISDLRVTKGVGRYTANFTPLTAHHLTVNDITPPTEAFPTAATYVAGTVLDDTSAPAARRVFAYSRASGAFLASTISDAGTGAFTMAVPEQCFVVCLDQDAGVKNAIVFDRITPFAG